MPSQGDKRLREFVGAEAPPTVGAVTVTEATVDIAAIPTLSVTFRYTSYVPASVGINSHVEPVAASTALPLRYHWYVNGDVPPDIADVNIWF